MRLKLTILYIILAVFLAAAGYLLFIQGSDPAPVAEEELEEYVTIREETKEGEFTPDFASLKAINDNLVCWLRIPDTTISFPVVLGEDNSFYLRHSFSGRESKFGCPFVDTRTPPEGDVLLIHGHNMGYNREEMFSPLVLLQDPSYAESHNKLYLSFPGEEGEREYTLLGVANLDVTNPEFDLYRSTFVFREEREGYLSYLQSKSLYRSSEEVGEGKILILSTCNDLYGENNRLLIIAVESSSF